MPLSTIFRAALLILAASMSPSLAAPGGQTAADSAENNPLLAARAPGTPVCVGGPPRDDGSCIDFIQHLQRRPFQILPTTVPRVINNADVFPTRPCFIAWSAPQKPFFSDQMADAGEFCLRLDPPGCKGDCRDTFTGTDGEVISMCISSVRACPNFP